MKKTPAESDLKLRTPDLCDGCLVIQVSGSKPWDLLAVALFLQKNSTQLLALDRDIFQSFLLISFQFEFGFSQKIGVSLERRNEYNPFPHKPSTDPATHPHRLVLRSTGLVT